jgi:glutathione S-transferase
VITDGGQSQAEALVWQWLFWEQYSHEPVIATSRFWKKFCDPADVAGKLAEARPKGLAALRLMEDHLEGRDWFVGASYSIADIALYAYTHVADAGGFPLTGYPHIRAWLDRVRAQLRHLTITERI